MIHLGDNNCSVSAYFNVISCVWQIAQLSGLPINRHVVGIGCTCHKDVKASAESVYLSSYTKNKNKKTPEQIYFEFTFSYNHNF